MALNPPAEQQIRGSAGIQEPFSLPERQFVQNRGHEAAAVVELRERVLPAEIVVVGGELIFTRVIANRTAAVGRFGPGKSGQVGQAFRKAPLSLQSQSMVIGVAVTIQGLDQAVGRKWGAL